MVVLSLLLKKFKGPNKASFLGISVIYLIHKPHILSKFMVMHYYILHIYNTSDVLEHKWRASLKTILFLYE